MKPPRDIFTRPLLPRVLLWLLLAGGTAGLAYAFSHMGLWVGLVFAMSPFAILAFYLSLRNPAHALFGLLVINYFIMWVGRYALDQPVGLILDMLILYNLVILVLHAMWQNVQWKRLRSGLTVVASIWVLYCVLQIVNPESISVKGWLSAVRALSFYFLAIVVLVQLLLDRYRYVKEFLLIWSVLTLIAVGKALIQKYIGFDEVERYWLYVGGGSVTHIIYSGTRYFSVYSDAANFSAGMGLAMVVLSISALYVHRMWLRIYLLVVAAAACYGLLLSGTRSALAVPFVGYSLYIVLSGRLKIILAGACLIFVAFFILNFTTIGNGNTQIRRARSAFNTQDASFQVRLTNQAKLRELMADKPFGAGLGHGGGKAKEFAPDSPISQIPTDSWFVMLWVETGVVGIVLHVSILLYILGYGSFQVVFRLKNPQLKGIIAAMVSGIAGVVVMSYGNEVLGQIPTGPIIYMCMGFIFLSPRFDAELAKTTPDLHPIISTT